MLKKVCLLAFIWNVFFFQLDKGEQKDHVKQNWERGHLVGNKSDKPAKRKIVLEK